MILVHARGNSEIGIGNLSRCYELIVYLSKTKDIVGIFECNQEVFQQYKADNIFHSNSFANSIKIIKKHSVDVYICDLLDADENLSDQLTNIGVKTIVHFNEVENGFQPDIVFRMDGFDYPYKPEGIEVYRGFKYYIVGEEVIKNRKKRLKPLNKIKNILISFGGADPAFYTEHFAKIISDTLYNYTIVLGPAMDKNRKKYIKELKKENIRYIDSPRNMVSLLLEHDLFITLGGMSTYEAMCLGVPTCGVRWKYLEYIVKSFGEKNMINDLGDINDSYLNMLNLNIEKVNNVCENAFNIIDGSALKNIEKVLNRIEND